MSDPRAEFLSTIATAEHALVAAAGRWQAAAVAPPWAYAVVASKFLAASSPHSLGLFGAQSPAAIAQIAGGFAAVFHPRDLRVLEPNLAAADVPAGATLRGVRYRDIMAADIVVHHGAQPDKHEPRAGSHVVWIAPTPPAFPAAMTRPDAMFAAVALHPAGLQSGLTGPWLRLSDIVAGHTDGRQLDEITVTWICTNAV